MLAKRTRRILLALAAWPAAVLAEGIFYGATGMTLFVPSEGPVFVRIVLAIGLALTAGIVAVESSE